MIWELEVIRQELDGLVFGVRHFGDHGITLRFDGIYNVAITCWRSL